MPNKMANVSHSQPYILDGSQLKEYYNITGSAGSSFFTLAWLKQLKLLSCKKGYHLWKGKGSDARNAPPPPRSNHLPIFAPEMNAKNIGYGDVLYTIITVDFGHN